MTSVRLLVAEIGYRRVNFLLCVLAVVVAAALFVAGPMLISAHSEETSREVQAQEARTGKQLEEMRQRLETKLDAKREKLDAELDTLVAANDQRLAEMRDETDQILEELEKGTRKAMKDLGFNLNIVHKDTTMGGLYMEHKVADMPEEYIQRLAEAEEINMIRHLVATLQAMIKWNDRTVLLVGFLPEVHQSHMSEKPPMGANIKEGTVIVGHELAAAAGDGEGGLKEGDTIQIPSPDGEMSFEVAQVLPEHGTQEDVTLEVHLHDAQKILGKPGLISQIMALGCHCAEANMPNIRAKLAEVLPDTRITEHLTRRLARAEQRDLVAKQRAELMATEKAACSASVREMQNDHQRILTAMEVSNQNQLKDTQAEGDTIVASLKASRESVQRTLSGLVRVTTPLVIIASAAFVALMLWNNVRERRQEIAVLRAIGKGAGTVASLFVGRAVLLGVIGGILGCLIGYFTARGIGQLLSVSAASFEFSTPLLVGTLVGAPLVAVLASYLPTLSAVRQDPAILLQDQ